MCSECGWSIGHAPGCPNAPDPEPVMDCVSCKEGIYVGDEYFDGPDGPICKECMDDMTATEILELFDEKFSTAEQPDPPEPEYYF